MQSHHDDQSNRVVFSTAEVNIHSANGNTISCRILLDSGSQSNFITESTCNLLGLKQYRNQIPIADINAISTRVTHRAKARLTSRTSDFSINVDWLVVPTITGIIPNRPIDTNTWDFPIEVPLADPMWNSPGRIDALIGAQYFWDLLLNERVTSPDSSLILYETKLGYIVCGNSNSNYGANSILCHLVTLEEVDHHIQAFWKMEEKCESPKTHTGEDLAFETQFSQTVTRDIEGRYIVQIPLRHDPSVLGNSRNTALRQFKTLEVRLMRQPSLYKEYRDFMKEYEQLGHMKEIPDIEEVGEYFIPHHAVRKDSSSTTKLRVVCNASAKTASGYSFNDIQMIGPIVQDSLFAILMRFRMHKYVMIADIEKMYRQTLIQADQTKLQRIFWRDTPYEPIKVFELRTVTYGTTSAPYLATRTLQQLFHDEGSTFPAAANAETDFYVDNYMSGCNTVEEGLEIQTQLIALMQRGSLHLRKWGSNNEKLLANIPKDDKETLEMYHFDNHTASTVKTLGLVFDVHNDELIFIAKQQGHDVISKRKVISEIAQIFDPLGIIGPVILLAKIFMQTLWRLGLGWDEALPGLLHQEWRKFQETLPQLTRIRIPRQVTMDPANDKPELHAFSDASESAYGSVIYLRNIDVHNNIGVNLLCS